MKRKLVPWNSQPQFAAPLDARFSAGMVALVNPGVGARDLIGGAPLVFVTGAPSFGTDLSGLVLRTPGSNDSYYATASPFQYASTSAALLLVFTATSAGGSDYASLGGVTNSGSNASPYVYISVARGGAGVGANTNLMLSWNAFGSPTNLAMTTNLVAGVTYAVLASAASGNQEIYLAVQHGNAFTVIEKVTGTTSGVLQATTGARIYVGDTFNARAPNTQTSLLALWNRRFTDGDARQLLSNPWQIAAPLVRRRRAVVASGIVFDAAANSGDIAAASSYSGSASWSGTNRMLSIDASMLGPGVSVSAMTYGGAACTFIGSKTTVTSLGGVECWRICSSDSGAPAAGANTLVVTLTGSIEFTVEWTSYATVNQSSPTEAFNSAQATNAGSATDASVIITSTTDNCWIHGAIVANDTSITANQTSRNNISGTLGSGANEDNNAAKTPAGAVTMSYSGMGITTTWAIAGYAIRPFGALDDLMGQACL